ncbi:MAG: leishmanolysin-related zinc metalloendopeptidase [Planctomycetota bacterium]
MRTSFKQIVFSAVVMAVTACTFMAPAPAQAGDIMDVNTSGITDFRLRQALSQAESFWESQLFGIRNDLPRAIKSNWNKVQIFATQADVDGPGGALAFAGVTSTIEYGGGGGFGNLPPGFGGQNSAGRPWVMSQAGTMTFDNADLGANDLVATAIHEMAHALGFGTLWEQNELLADQPNGFREYVGTRGLDVYRGVRGDPTLTWVSLEKIGGGGTAGAHWDTFDPAFQGPGGTTAIMTGFANPLGTFLSDVTLGQFVDLGFANRFHPDFFDGVIVGGFPDKWTIQAPPFSFRQAHPSSVPEPGSLAVLAGLTVLALGRRRRAQD